MRSAKEQTKNRVAIAGQVRNDKTKLAIPGVLVEISKIEGKFKNWLDLHALQYGKSWEKMVKRPDRTITAIDGCFGFINLPDGEYTLRIYKVNATTHIFANENQMLCTKIHDNKISVKKDKHRWEDIFINVDIIPTIKGKIKDETNNPIQNAEVKIGDGLQPIKSDKNGDYQLKYPDELYLFSEMSVTFEVCATGYKSVSRIVKLSQSEILEVQNFKLTPEQSKSCTT